MHRIRRTLRQRRQHKGAVGRNNCTLQRADTGGKMRQDLQEGHRIRGNISVRHSHDAGYQVSSAVVLHVQCARAACDAGAVDVIPSCSSMVGDVAVKN